MLSLQPLQNYFDSLISMTRGWTETGIATSAPGSVGSVSRLWVQLAFAPVAHVLNAIVRFERSQIAAPADEPAIAAPITSEVFARHQQPLHPSWLGMLRDVAGEFVIANASDAQPDEPAIAPSPAAAPAADESQQPLFSLVQLSDAIAYFLNNATGEIQCTYAGFSSKAKATAWGQWLLSIPQVRFELRTAKRLQGFKWELKIKGLTIGQIQRLAQENLSKSPKIEPTAPSKFTFSEVPDFDKICPIWSCWLAGKMIGRITERLVMPGFRHSRQRPNDTSGYSTREGAAAGLLTSIEAEDASIQRTRRIVLGDAFVDAFGGFAG